MVFSSHVWTVELVIFFFWDVLTAVTKDKALERRGSQIVANSVGIISDDAIITYHCVTCISLSYY